MIVKVVIPDSIYARVYFARGEQGPQGATGPQGVQGAQGPTGLTGPAGTNGTNGVSYTPGDPIYVTVRNATGSLIPKGSIVYTSGSNGNHVHVTLAQATSDATSARTLGWTSENIAVNADGLVMVEGYLEGLNTQGITAGAQLYLSPTVPGGFTETKPSAPDHLVYVGVAVKISSGDGHVYVKVQNGYELDEIHDVAISSPVNNQVLTYESSTGLWKNKVNPADGVTSVTATSPLTGGTITSTGSIGLDQTLLAVTQSQVTNLVSDLANTAKLNTANTFTTGGHVINNNAVGTVPLQVNAVAGQTADVLQVRNSSGTSFVSINNLGSLQWGSGSGSFLSGTNGRLNVFLSDAAAVGATVRGASGQTADYLQVQNNSATTLLSINSLGGINNPTAGNISLFQRLGGAPFLGTLSVGTNSASQVGAVVRGAASQTANLQEWQNSAGTVLATVLSGGGVRAPFYQVGSSGLVTLATANSGGQIYMAKQTAQAASPGSGNAHLYFRDGTNAGTLKLVVRAGAAGAETTILDNIPQ